MARKVDELAGALRALPMIAALPPEEFKALRGAGTEVQHRQGSEIVRQGAAGVGFHIILDGSARVEVSGTRVAALGRGDIFGEMSTIDNLPRSASVIAESDVRSFSVPSWAANPMLDKSPALSRALLREMSIKLRRTSSSQTE